jgi:hypothetical protein
MRNIIDLKSHHHDFKAPGLKFIVSSRQISRNMNLIDYLKVFYIYTDIKNIDSVFGNTTTFCPLYGGRSFKFEHSLTEKHLYDLEKQNIGLSLPLTNHFFSEAAYKESLPLLKTHHKKGNSIICTNDNLALRIKKDFPLYSLKASIIKNIDTQQKVDGYLELYDYITIPMDKNDDDRFLQSLIDKNRIILFANANCAYTCPQRTCYLGFSQKIAGNPVTSGCSKGKIPRLDIGAVYFDIKKFQTMGYTQFKLVPLAPAAAPGVTSFVSQKGHS